MAKKPTYEELENESFEHKRAEEERDLTLSQFRATLEATVDGIIVVGLDAETRVFSKQFKKIWHMPDSVLDSKDANQALDYVLDQINEPEVFSKKVQAVFADPNSNTFDTLHLKDGRILEVYSRPQKLEDKIIGRVWAFRDVTKAKQAIMERQKAQSRLQALSDASFEAVFFSDQGVCIDQNSAAERMFGYSHKEAIGRNGAEWIVPEDREKVKNNMLAGYEKPYEVTALRKDGSTFPAEIQGHMFNFMGKPTRVTALRDNSVQQQAREALRKSEERKHLALEGTEDGMWEWNPQTGEIYFDPNTQRVLGYEYDEKDFNFDWWQENIHPDSFPIFKEALNAYLEGQAKYYELEYQIRTKAGDWIWVWTRGKCVEYDNQGQPTRFIGTHRDITSRKQAEGNIKRQARILDLIFEHSLDSIVLLDKDYNFIRVSETYAKACQRESTEFPGHNHFEFFPSDFKDEADEAKKGKYIYKKSARPFVFPDHPELGTTYWNIGLVPILDKEGEIELFLFTLKDVTGQMQAEEALKKSEEKFRTFTEMAPVGVFVTDADGLTTYWNKRLCKITGMQVVEGLGMGWADGVHPDDRERVFKEWYESAEKRASFCCEYRFVDRDGTVTYTIGQAIPLTDASRRVTEYVGTITDITDLKQAQEALRVSEERLDMALSGSNQGIWDWHPDNNTVYFDSRYYTMAGYEPNEFPSVFEEWEKRVHPDDIQQTKLTLKQYMAGDLEAHETKFRFLRKDGVYMWIRAEGKIVSRDEKGNPKRFVGIHVDISERKQTEEALRIKDYAIASSINAIAMVDLEGNLTYVNLSFIKMWGYDNDKETLGKPAVGFWQTAEEVGGVVEALKTGKGWIGELVARKKDGSLFDVQLSVSMITDEGGTSICMMASCIDTTERNQADEALKISLKEKEILLKEIHHRVKNNFQIISSLLDMRIMRIDDQRTIDYFEDARAKIDTMSLIHEQLYKGSRFDRIDMGRYTEKLLDYISQVCESEFCVVTPVIEAENIFFSINQAIPCAIVLNELIFNAYKHAFMDSEEGTVRISLEKLSGDMIYIRVKDDGVGMPDEIDFGKTNTLGLKLVRTIVRDQLMGTIRINRDQGTEIVIEFKHTT